MIFRMQRMGLALSSCSRIRATFQPEAFVNTFLIKMFFGLIATRRADSMRSTACEGDSDHPCTDFVRRPIKANQLWCEFCAGK
jgi:hypothetical protein